MLKPSNYLRHFWFGVVCLGPVPSAAHLLLALVVPVSVGLYLYASRLAFFSCCFGLLSLVVVARCFVVAVVLLLFALVAFVLAVWPALSWLPSPPLGCLLVFSGPVSVLLVPPSGYLVVFATVRLSYLRYGVSWLIGSCLHSASWQQRLRPCAGLCPLHHVVGVVHVPLAPSLRYSPSCDPEYLRTPLKLHAPAFLACAAFSLLSCCLPGRLLFPSLMACLPPPVCPPCGPLSWLVLVAPPSVWSWFVLLAGLFGFVLFVPGWFLFLCFAFGGFFSRHSGQVRSCYLLSPALLRPLS